MKWSKHNMSFKKVMATFVLAIIIVSSCTDDFEELNTKPDELIADNVGTNQLGQALAQSQYHGLMILSWRHQISQSLFADLYAQYFATTASNFDSDQHLEVGRWIDLGWTSFYGNAAPQLDFVEKTTREQGLVVQNAIANVWKVTVFHRITDYWGPILYSEFGNGESVVNYDTQESVYKDFFIVLDEAVATLKDNVGGNAFGSNDIVYGGDVAKWLTFANSLRLRLAMRIRYVEPQLAQQEAEKAIQDGVMTTNADNANVLTTPDNRNPYFTITDWGEFRMSAAMESVMNGFEDPRIGEFFSPAVNAQGDDGPFQGLHNGIPKPQKNTPVLNGIASDMAPKFLNGNRGGTNPDWSVMHASEVALLQAEGALIGWDMGGGTAKNFYEQGIRLSLEDRTNASAQEIDDYITSTNKPRAVTGEQFEFNNLPPLSDIPVAFDESAGQERKLEQIITQKWIALYPNGMEAFAEVRRTGYPDLYPIIESLNPDVPEDEIIRRFTFVSSEDQNNPEGVNAARQMEELTSRGGDKNSTHLWWDAKNQ